MKLVVITEVPERKGIGNLASAIELYFEEERPSPRNNFEGKVVDLHEVDPNLAMIAALKLRAPVFHLGEVLLVDEDGREVGGLMRKPNKWDVTYEEFSLVGDAYRRVQEVMA